MTGHFGPCSRPLRYRRDSGLPKPVGHLFGPSLTTTVTARKAGGGTTLNYQVPVLPRRPHVGVGRGRNRGESRPGAWPKAIWPTTFVRWRREQAATAYALVPATVPTAVRIRAVDSDGVTSLRRAPATTVEGSAAMRSGRFRSGSAYGTEFIALRFPPKSSSGAAGWQRNTADTCMPPVVPTAANGGLSFRARRRSTSWRQVKPPPASIRQWLREAWIAPDRSGETMATSHRRRGG